MGHAKEKVVKSGFTTPTARKKTTLNKELGEKSAIGKLFINALETLDEKEEDYYFQTHST